MLHNFWSNGSTSANRASDWSAWSRLPHGMPRGTLDVEHSGQEEELRRGGTPPKGRESEATEAVFCLRTKKPFSLHGTYVFFFLNSPSYCLPSIAVVFWHPWLRELYATDFNKPGIYRGERPWAKRVGLISSQIVSSTQSSRVRCSRRVTVEHVVVCFEGGEISVLFSFLSLRTHTAYGMHHFLRNSQDTWKRWLVECATQEIHDHHRILNVVVTSLTSHDGMYPWIILGRCTRCTRRSSYGLISTHSPDCPRPTCTTSAGSTGQKGSPPEWFRLGCIQLALFTEFPNCVLLFWLVYLAAMLVWYTAIHRPSHGDLSMPLSSSTQLTAVTNIHQHALP